MDYAILLEVTACDLKILHRPQYRKLDIVSLRFSSHHVPVLREKRMTRLDRIECAILPIRGERVMLDADLAALYGVSVKALNQAVKRNRNRFPGDFMFQLKAKEAASLRSQTVTLDRGRGRYRKYLPYAFTEQGVAMLSSVLRSERAVRVNIAIMRAFVRLRQLVASHADLKPRLEALERKYDSQFKVVFDAIRALMEPAPQPGPARRMGFRTEEPADELRVKTPRAGSRASPRRAGASSRSAARAAHCSARAP
jgi:hypothetical protein